MHRWNKQFSLYDDRLIFCALRLYNFWGVNAANNTLWSFCDFCPRRTAAPGRQGPVHSTALVIIV